MCPSLTRVHSMWFSLQELAGSGSLPLDSDDRDYDAYAF